MEKVREKKLIIGNRFDKAHGLPTSYLCFIDSCKAMKEYKNSFVEDEL